MTEDKFEQKIDEQIPESVKTQAEKYDDEVKEYTKSLESINDLKELEGMEKPWLDKIGENTDRLKKVTYSLPENCTFRGTTFSRGKIGEFVADFLGSQEIGWQMTLGFFDLISFWKNIKDVSEVSYEYYDATLQLLGKMRYKGFENIRRILACNALFAGAHEAYINDIAYTYYLADMHTAVQNRMDAINALTKPNMGK